MKKKELNKKPKYKVGDETNFLVNGIRAKVERVVEWDDGIILYKLERYGGLVKESKC